MTPLNPDPNRGSAGSRAEDAGNGTMKEKIKEGARGAKSEVGAIAREKAQNARESLVQFYRDQPLLAGSLGIAIGAALGALVAPTKVDGGSKR